MFSPSNAIWRASGESWAKVQDLSDKIIIACVWASGEWKLLFVCSTISMPDKVTINTAYYKNNTQREQKGKRWFRIFSVATVTGRWLSSIISDLWLPKFPFACCSLSCYAALEATEIKQIGIDTISQNIIALWGLWWSANSRCQICIVILGKGCYAYKPEHRMLVRIWASNEMRWHPQEVQGKWCPAPFISSIHSFLNG